MPEHRSFEPTDFSLRDIPGFLFAFVIVSALCVAAGLALRALPPFWSGLLCGVGLGFLGALALLLPKRKKVDVSNLPAPSALVRAQCDDPNITLVEAVKTYRDETGASLTEAAAVLKAYVARESLSS